MKFIEPEPASMQSRIGDDVSQWESRFGILFFVIHHEDEFVSDSERFVFVVETVGVITKPVLAGAELSVVIYGVAGFYFAALCDVEDINCYQT